MTIDTLWRLASAPILIGANAFFVAVEFALTRLPALDLTDDDLEASSGLRRAHGMLDRLEIHLTGCQLGISVTSVLLGVIAEPAITRLIEPIVALAGVTGNTVRVVSVAIAVVILNLIHKVWGEQAPTYLGVERPRQVAERLAPVLHVWSTLAHPIILLGDGAAKWTLRLFGVEVTRSWAEDETAAGEVEPVGDRAELRRRIGELLTQSLPRDRREEVMASIEIDEIPCGDVMVDVEAMVPLALDLDGSEVRERIGRGGHARYPVLHRDRADLSELTVDDIAGILYVPALFRPPDRLLGDRLELEELIEPIVPIDVGTPVAELIDRLQEQRQEMALVRRGEEVVGVVTVTDALEAIAGELRDPLDPGDGPGGDSGGEPGGGPDHDPGDDPEISDG